MVAQIGWLALGIAENDEILVGLEWRRLSTFVLIHGAGDGGWYWHLVEAELRARWSWSRNRSAGSARRRFTRDAARTATSGSALGVDISEEMVTLAVRLACLAGHGPTRAGVVVPGSFGSDNALRARERGPTVGQRKMRGDDSAIVIGAGFAGLAAAAVLSHYFARVVVFDRDDVGQGAAARRCVPQGQHVHLLLAKGFRVLSQLFPGLIEELIEDGGKPFDIGQELEYWRRGQRKLPFPAGLKTIAVSRPALEGAVRKRVTALGNVELRGHSAVDHLHLERGRISGVQLAGGERWTAQLVVDAAGRGSRVRRWLQELDYPTPRSTKVEIELGYASRFVRLSRETPQPWKMLYVAPSANTWTRGGALMKVEGERALLTLAGYLREHPPLDDHGFREFADSLGFEFARALRGAEFLGDARHFSAGAMVRYHFEDLKRHPAGLLAIGDAICLLDPSFGQGMTIALLQAQLLGSLLREGRRTNGLQRKFYRGARAIVDLAWAPTAAENFRRPGMTGVRPALLDAIHWYSDNAMELADRDADVHRTLQETLHLTAGPHAVLRPALLAKVLSYAVRRPR